MEAQKLIAENHIVITKELFYEGFGAVQLARYKKTVKELVLALLGLGVLLAAWLLATGGSLLYLAGEAVFAAALLIWLTAVLPRTVSRSNYRKLAGDSVQTPERTVRFYRDHMTVSSRNTLLATIPYEDVLEMLETKRLRILNCRDKRSVMLGKDGFTVYEDTKGLPVQIG